MAMIGRTQLKMEYLKTLISAYGKCGNRVAALNSIGMMMKSIERDLIDGSISISGFEKGKEVVNLKAGSSVQKL